jgi:pimeloyl-ACP methyl ester carboxylesterase
MMNSRTKISIRAGGLVMMTLLFVAGCTRVWVNPGKPLERKYPFEAKRATVNGMEICYVDEGAGSPVIFIHGLGGSLNNWSLTIPHVAKNGYRAVAIDLPGNGMSSKPATNYTMELFADTAYSLMSSLDSSMGGLISQVLTLKHPEIVKKLVLVDSAGGQGPYPEILLSVFEKFMGLDLMYNLTENQLRKLLEGAFYTPNEKFEIMFSGWAAVRNSSDFPGFVHAFNSSLLNVTRTNSIGRLGEIKTPALIIWGRNDRMPLKHARKFHAGIQGSKLAIFDKAGHIPMLERAEDFNELLLAFLKGADLKELPEKIQGLEIQ